MKNAQTVLAEIRPDVYQRITDRIIALLESGTVPWRLPWKADGPRNLLSKRPYRGINAFLLNAMRYTSPYWQTFLQVQSLGAKVRRGERASPIILWKWIKVEEEEEEIPLLRHFSVFNVEQVEGLPASVIPSPQEIPFSPIQEAENVVARMPLPPEIKHGAAQASYRPEQDLVCMPKAEPFKNAEDYYSTLFHEVTHATGHASRLARKEVMAISGFGSDPYSREELVAEMRSSFLCGHCGIEQGTLDNSAAYINHWIARLRGDRRLIVSAAAKAQKACDFILHRPAQEDVAGTSCHQP